MDNRVLGYQVYSAREDRRITKECLAGKCSVTPAYLCQIEQGKRLPSLSLFVDFCNTLQVSPIFLLNGNLSKEKQDTYERFKQILLRATPSQAQVIVSIMETLEKVLPDAIGKDC